MFYREGLLAPRPTPKLEDHPLLTVHDCLFNLFAATLHIGGRSSIRNLRTRHAVVTGTHYTWMYTVYTDNNLTINSTTEKSVADCIKESIGNFPNTMLIHKHKLKYVTSRLQCNMYVK